jgi:hypothetical protein
MGINTGVNYQESLSIKVGVFLRDRGCAIATISGVAKDVLERTNSFGVLYKDPDAKPIKRFFGLFRRNPRRAFLGTVWLNSDARRADEKNWVFELYGRKYHEFVRQLADELSAVFNVKIDLLLVRERPDVEAYDSDYEY